MGLEFGTLEHFKVGKGYFDFEIVIFIIHQLQVSFFLGFGKLKLLFAFNNPVKLKLGFFALQKEADAALFAEFFGTQHLQVVEEPVAVGNELLLWLVLVM